MLGTALMKTGGMSQNETEFEYNMPRPQSQLSDFDLSERDIETIKIENQKPAQAGTVTEHKLIPLPDKDTKKKEDLKKAAAKKKADALKKAQENQKRLQISMANTKAEAWKVSGTEISGAAGTNNGNRGGYYSAKAEGAKDTVDAKTQKEKINWADILMAQPTKENANKMLGSFADGETTRADYFQVAIELLKDNNSNRHEIGLYLLSKAQGPEALMALIDYSSTMEESEKSEFQQSQINGYAQASFYPAIANLIANPKYTDEALRLTNFAIVKASSLQPSAEPPRGGINRTFMSSSQNQFLQSLKVFVGPLNTVVQKSQDQNSVSVAKATLNQINSMLQTNSSVNLTAVESDIP
jgi:hypothetical protein